MSQSTEPIERILAQAVEIDSASERQAFVERACAGDAVLRARVERLIDVHFRAGSFLERPAAVLETSALVPTDDAVGTQIGPYKLLEQIGEGGMGLVFVAEQQRPVRRTVALKLIKPGMDTKQVVARFEAERQALAVMDHPNIAKVLDAGATDAGRPYFVMELVRGIPITEYCDQACMSIQQRLVVFVQVCRAIQHAHTKGVIHRDLKPTNVLVTSHDGVPVPMVIDFGVAKALGQQLTERTLHTGFAQMIGTPLYMSPEQAEFNQLGVDTRSDIYSLGVLLYELLTGATPFDGERLKTASFDELRRILREEEPPRPSARLSTLGESLSTASEKRGVDARKLTQTLHGELDWIVLKALEKDRNRRYETATGLADDVRRYLNDEAVQASPPSARYRFRKFARRNKHAVAAAGVLGLALMIAVGAVSGSVGWVVSDRAARWKETDRAVNVALTESKRLQDQLKPGDALVQVKQASAILASGASTPALQQRVRERLDDLTFVSELEEIRANWGTMRGSYTSQEALDQTDQRFAEAFRQFGIDFDSLSPEEAALRLGRRTVAVEVAAAMDTWVSVARKADEVAVAVARKGEAVAVARKANVDKTRWQRLLAVARAIDPEPMRSQLRDIVEREDNEGLRALFKTIRVEELSAQTALFFAYALEAAGSKEDAVKLLLVAQLRHPADYWLCAHLSLSQVTRTSGEDGLRFAALSAALKPESADSHYTLGAYLLDRDRVDEAIAAFREAVRREPDDATANYFLGKGLEAQGDLEGALAVYREVIRLYPDNAGAHEDLGNAFARQGKFDDAIACLQKVVRLTPYARKRADALINIGELLQKQEKWSEALASFREAVNAKPDLAFAHNNAAWLLATCPDRSVRDPAQAVKFAQKAVDLAPQAGEPRNTLGVAHYGAENWKDAIAALEDSVAMREGGDSLDWFFLAMAHWQLGDKEKARKAYEQAVEWMETNKPNDEELIRFRAEAAELLGVKDESNSKEVPPPRPDGE